MTSTRLRPGAPPSPAQETSGRWHPLELLPPLLVLLLGTLLLRPGHGLWFDELFTAEVARLPLGEILSAVVTGAGTTSYLAGVPPSYNAPYYLVAHGWTALPGLGGDTSLRALSLLATAGGLALTTRAVARLAGRATGVLAGTVLAGSPLVLEQAVEARSYGLAVLATGGAALGLVRWLQEPPRGLVLFGLAGAGMGLAHWYAVTVLAAFVVAGLLRRRSALPLLLTGGAAALPVVALVGLNLLNGTGGRNAEHLRDTGGQLAGLALRDWSGGQTPLLCLTLGLAVLGGLRATGLRAVAACWALVPLLLLLAAELVRPVYLPRYLMTGLLGVGVLAAAGVRALPRAARAPVAALLVAFSLGASLTMFDRAPRERADDVVRLLAEVHRPGQPIVAADQRSAIGLDHYVRTLEPGLRPDVVLPPDDAPGDAGDVVWLVRRLIDWEPEPTDDDAVLAAAGFRQVDQVTLPGSKTVLVLQRWER
ncbi:glycosyltransferase family 39 protein [Modestobacter marinus]|uniref:glycosyltransferase family 39 protein n=1 Tax=Modestobacter marinus TaxID=477641 RepID=UPI001C9413EE|nr:glycosyltransferase family 39 protein [Modestobacter marinus]